MKDSISRQAAIELKPEFLNPNVNRETEEQTAIDRAYARGWNSCNTHWIDEISELPSAQPEQRWIPCSERLPKERDWYLGIFKEPDTGWINPVPFICDYLLGIKTKATTKEGWILKGFTDREEYIDYYFNLECVAWMPLPEPYNEGDHE